MRTSRTERHWRLLSPVLLEQQDLFIVPAKVDLFDSLMLLCKQCLSVCFSTQSLLLSRTLVSDGRQASASKEGHFTFLHSDA